MNFKILNLLRVSRSDSMQCGTWQEVRQFGSSGFVLLLLSLSKVRGKWGAWNDIRSRPLIWGHSKSPTTQVTLSYIRHPCEPSVFLRRPSARGKGSVRNGVPPPVLDVVADGVAWTQTPLLHALHLSPWASVCWALKLTKGREWERKDNYLLFHLIRKAYPAPPTLCWSQELNHELDSHTGSAPT